MNLQDDFSIELSKDNCKDRHVFLKGKNGFWLFPIETAEYDGFTAQKITRGSGLHGKVKDTYWKFLSSLSFKVEHNGEKQDLQLTRINANLSKITYHFKSDKFLLRVTYQLLDKKWDKTSGKVSFEFEAKCIKDFELIISPLLNIKEGNNEESHFYDIKRGAGLLVNRDGRGIGFFPTGQLKMKNGGERIEDFSESETPLRIGKMKFDIDKKIDFYMVAGENVSQMDLHEISLHNKNNKERELELEKYGIGRETMLENIMNVRTLIAKKFITERSNMKVPEGDFGEIFERLYHDMDFYQELLGDNNIEKIFMWGSLFLSESEKNIILKNRLWYILSLGKYLTSNENKTLKRTFKEEIMNLISKSDNNMMLETPRNEIEENRIPKKWTGEALLPDTNALWVTALELFDNITGRSQSLHMAIKSYRDVFWNGKNYLYNAIDGEKKDDRKNIHGLIGFAMLPHLFSRNELENAHKVLKNGFIVKRKPKYFDRGKMPFGLLDIFQENEGKITIDKAPYLFEFYKQIGKENLAEQLMVNILDHQLSEGALFYPHKTFKSEYEKNPVPEINSITLSSNYIEPFLSFMKRRINTI